METEQIKHDEQELEEGELNDSDDGYIPLQRPGVSNASPLKVQGTGERSQFANSEVAVTIGTLPDPQQGSDSDEDNFTTTDSSDESDVSNKLLDGRKKKKRREIKKHRPMKPVRPVGRARPEKYNVWAQTLQEDLMENMRGCDVNNHRRDRQVETYDYRIKYRLNGDTEAPITGVKRRQSYSDDSDTSNLQQQNHHQQQDSKRFRTKNYFSKQKVSAKLRLGPRVSGDDSCNSNDGIKATARHVLDLAVSPDSSNEEIAQDIAMKLYEEKDDLLLHAINTIGSEIPIKLFAETQKIELDGGMMTMDGYRRRTPGGVFLFLLKHCTEITKEQKKIIFYDDKKKFEKKRKNSHETKRDQKVEQLKKSLSLTSGDRERKDSLSLLNPESSNPSLSNPPPSPVTDDCTDGPDMEPSVKIVNESETTPSVTPKPPQNKNTEPNIVTAYDDDFLDMNCDDMDLF